MVDFCMINYKIYRVFSHGNPLCFLCPQVFPYHPWDGSVYLPIHEWFIFFIFNGKLVGKYTRRPMDGMGLETKGR